MFWGLKIEPGKIYEQTVQQSFHVSMACLEMNNSDNNFIPLMLDMHNQEYILCYLQKNKAFQCQLDLKFKSGDKVAFYSSGTSRIHLTGYLIEDDNIDYSPDLVSSEEEEKVEKEESTPVKNTRKLMVNNLSSSKRRNEPQVTKQQVKKPKIKDDGDDDDSTVSGVEELYLEEDSDSDSSISGDNDDDDVFEIGESSLEEDTDSDSDSDVDEDTKTSEPKKKKLNKSLQKEQSKKKKKKKKKEETPNEEAQAGTPRTRSSTNEGTPALLSSKKQKKENETPWKSGRTPGRAGGSAKKIRPDGVIVEDIEVGDGEPAKSGKRVAVYYVGRLKQNNKQFDATTRGPGFKFRLGTNEVIKGWDVGVLGMRVGGKRRITCPADMAYGTRGLPPMIPSNSTLVFEVELKSIN